MKTSTTIIIGFLVIVGVASFLYFSSGYFKRQLAVYTGYSEICVDKVVYLQFISGATVKVKPDGLPVTCN